MRLCGSSAVRLAAASAAAMVLCLAPAGASARSSTPPPVSDIPQLVRATVRNELHARRHPRERFRYIRREVDSDGSQTEEIVETPAGELARLLLVNGHPPKAPRLRKNRQKLSRMLSNSKFRRQQFKDQQQDLQRENKILSEMPAAFHYRLVGEENGLVRLRFRPNPDYSPKSHEALILTGMAGTMWIDSQARRIERIDGTLIQDVTMGWGLVVRLNSGGKFEMQQKKLADGAWKMNRLRVDFDGHKFVFVGVHVHEKLYSRSFHEVPDHLTVAEAVKLLRGSNPPALSGSAQASAKAPGAR